MAATSRSTMANPLLKLAARQRSLPGTSTANPTARQRHDSTLAHAEGDSYHNTTTHCCSLKKEHGYDPVVMVGDGATDLEARPPADLFIGFGGVAVREVVKENADWFVTDLEAITEALEADDE